MIFPSPASCVRASGTTDWPPGATLHPDLTCPAGRADGSFLLASPKCTCPVPQASGRCVMCGRWAGDWEWLSESGMEYGLWRAGVCQEMVLTEGDKAGEQEHMGSGRDKQGPSHASGLTHGFICSGCAGRRCRRRMRRGSVGAGVGAGEDWKGL